MEPLTQGPPEKPFPSKWTIFNPISSRYTCLTRSKDLSRLSRAAIWITSIFVGIITVGIGATPTFRSLVGRCVQRKRDSQPKNQDQYESFENLIDSRGSPVLVRETKLDSEFLENVERTILRLEKKFQGPYFILGVSIQYLPTTSSSQEKYYHLQKEICKVIRNQNKKPDKPYQCKFQEQVVWEDCSKVELIRMIETFLNEHREVDPSTLTLKDYHALRHPERG